MFRKLSQAFVGLLGWIAFSLLWWVAFRDLPPLRQVLTGLMLISEYTTFVAVATYGWVTWRVLLWRRHGPAPERLPCAYDYSRDVTGRGVAAEFQALKLSRYVVVDVAESATGAVKTYAAGDEMVTSEEAAACTA